MTRLLHIGVYPGTFDPITLGHLDIIQRATRLVDRLIIAVATNTEKTPLFSLNERIHLIKHELKSLPLSKGSEVLVKSFDTLLVNFAKKEGAQVLIRGLRPVSDFEYEFQMAGTNRTLSPELETVFLVASEKCQLIASHLVKEIARLKGDITPFVSKHVAEKLKECV
ncbi:MAG: phosphopantetheine adenylyltransferase [uncultured bacterium]|nr:MAG: phosphopantetheine adenylyltransferase [uncultured bacterium]OFW69462.1 MAG: pantetheine-phosphate adenylyltransferase [Alphaproteobacteria bacterium GWC2_42_16]OFW74179.1 MAG: pantetheine-phosphate adenylyltransferase [Alphaproteobacteria bacterium GWA2_41_27]OFW84349.1 MAG: pantetheine-phosphate adenylyltransferase [Alphaproteobacteria bacterium RIFCSPHIGHO2_12_FULL_42_100]OFW84727.1 MAG: pantetheine-phosphate adenylyltransferase [Alphaproteobacteria bacterium RBG_16_42_14]OFW90923.1